MAEQIELTARQKIKLFEEGMKGDHILLHLDARRCGVEVPAHLAESPVLTLKLSYLFQGETKHDEQGVTAYLKFDGAYYRCTIPWTAVWGITLADQRNKVWTEDAPREVLLQLSREKLIEAGKKLFGLKKNGGAQEPPAGEGDPDKTEKKNGKAPRLVRIK